MAICDAHWEWLAEPRAGPPDDASAAKAGKRYKKYVNAVNELGRRGPEIRSWARARLQHQEYDAREQAAWLIGQLGGRGQLGDQLVSIAQELCDLAVRPIEMDSKEVQANTAAVVALGKIGHSGGIAGLRRVLTSPEWEGDDLQWEAAQVLGRLVNEPFADAEDVVEAAQEWLGAHPDAQKPGREPR
jgi:hypothetical protein